MLKNPTRLALKNPEDQGLVAKRRMLFGSWWKRHCLSYCAAPRTSGPGQKRLSKHVRVGGSFLRKQSSRPLWALPQYRILGIGPVSMQPRLAVTPMTVESLKLEPVSEPVHSDGADYALCLGKSFQSSKGLKMRPEHEVRREQAAALATQATEKHKFTCSGDRHLRIMAWLLPRTAKT
jgi:hypothetical protein